MAGLATIRPRRLASKATFVVTIVAVSAATMVLLLVAAGDLLGRWHVEPILSGSMRPGIRPGDAVLLLPQPASAVRPGEIVSFHPPGLGGVTVVHRVIGVAHQSGSTVIRTKGDANNVADGWNAKLLGDKAFRVRAVIPRLGYLAVAAHGHLGEAAIVVALLCGGLWIGVTALRPPAGARDVTGASAAVG